MGDQEALFCAYLLDGLGDLQKSHPVIDDVRGCGLMVAFELQPGSEEIGARLHKHLLSNGIIMEYRSLLDVFFMMPPFVITKEEIDRVIGVLDEGLSLK